MEACFRTNFHGPLNITRAFLPFLRERGTGTLVYLSSQAAWHVDISAGAYCASKFALEAEANTHGIPKAPSRPSPKNSPSSPRSQGPPR
ncbi:hypothetical protein ColLi_07854 [Colletotrichum liriopes]|uniref:Uncharacterized protein n=1 Tax=Colletotrichum liriopes TaxID=708192 RepID=A0AA37LUS9_9PEZI|nr:hypothetical protein ColLi_07854 [Colletotrichum liriopes]